MQSLCQKWLTGGSSSTRECSELIPCFYLSDRCRKGTNSVMCILMTWRSSQSCISPDNELEQCPRAARARNMCGKLSMPTTQSKGSADFRAEFWGGALDGIAGTFGFTMCQSYLSHVWNTHWGRPRSYTHVFTATSWGLELCVKLQTRSFMLSRRCLPRVRHRAVVASRSQGNTSGAGACVAPVTVDLWRTLYSIAEEQDEHVRLIWGSSPSPLEFTPSRCACAALVTPADWSVLFEYQFRAPDHINVLELTALTSLVRHLANGVARGSRESYVASTAASFSERFQKGASPRDASVSGSGSLHSSVSTRLCQSICRGCHLGETLPTRCRAAPRSPAGQRSLPAWPPQAPTLQFGSPAVAREIKLLREPLPEAAVQKVDRTTLTRSEDRWRRQLHITAGDIEPNAGPDRRRPCPFQDLLQSDVMPRTEALVGSREAIVARVVAVMVWVVERGIPCIVECTVRYFRSAFHAGVLAASQIGTLISSLRRYVTLVRSLGGALPDSSSHFNVVWKILDPGGVCAMKQNRKLF